jgi:hypothetical protein
MGYKTLPANISKAKINSNNGCPRKGSSPFGHNVKPQLLNNATTKAKKKIN